MDLKWYDLDLPRLVPATPRRRRLPTYVIDQCPTCGGEPCLIWADHLKCYACGRRATVFDWVLRVIEEGRTV